MKSLFLFLVLVVQPSLAQAAGNFWLGHRFSVGLSFDTTTQRADAPTPKSVVPPKYPSVLVVNGIAGQAILDFTVGTDGAVSAVTMVSSTQTEFRDSALEAIRTWTFNPAIDRATGRPESARVRCVVSFLVTEESVPDPMPAPAAAARAETSKPLPRTPFAVSVGDLAGSLKEYGLAPLSAGDSAKIPGHIRFLWLRSFHPPALFDIRIDQSGSSTYEAFLWKEADGRNQWVSVSKSSRNSNAQTLRDSLEKIGFFELPASIDRSGFDGSQWFIEASLNGKYHAVYRWSPDSGPFYDFGRGLIESAIQSDFLPIY